MLFPASRSKQTGKVAARPAICFLKIHIRVRELVVGDDELPGVNKSGATNLIQMRRNNYGGQTFTETGDKIECARRTVAEQLNAVKNFT